MSLGELDYKDARIAHLEQELEALKASLKYPVARLYGIHPDDLRQIKEHLKCTKCETSPALKGGEDVKRVERKIFVGGL